MSTKTKVFFSLIIIALIVFGGGFLLLQGVSWILLRYPKYPLQTEMNNVYIEPVTSSEEIIQQCHVSYWNRKKIQSHPESYRTVKIDCTVTNATEKTLHAWRCDRIESQSQILQKMFLNKNPYPFESEAIRPGESREVRFIAIIFCPNVSDELICSAFKEADLYATATTIGEQDIY